VRSWENLSDYEFENLVADLLEADLSFRFERFTRGRDGGIDLRHIPRRGRRPDIAQAKHYRASTYSNLRSAARTEARRLRDLNIRTRSYRFVTSLGLTPANKSELASILGDWVTREDHILGRDDVESLLDAHPDVERRHVKLWLNSGAQLDALLRAGTHARSRVLAQDIVRSSPLYVQGDSFLEAHRLLNDRRVLLVAGSPGIGKTTLARMLIGDAIVQGYEPIEVSGSIDEAWEVWDPEVRQVFLYDDFLGRTVVGELAKNEDSRLLSFMREVGKSNRSLLVLTTREYILQEAVQSFEAFRRHGLRDARFVLVLDSYSPLDRAKILHNHVWHSELPMEAKEELAVDRGYSRIVTHENFNPRVIEYITGLQSGHRISVQPGESWLDFAVYSLDHPTEIWAQAFDRELGPEAHALLMCLATLPREAEIGDLQSAFIRWASSTALRHGQRDFEDALRVVDDSFTTTRRLEGDVFFVSFANPGVADFLQERLLADPAQVAIALRSAVFIEQVEIIWRLLARASPTTRDPTSSSDETANAITRLFSEPSANWWRVQRGGGRQQFQRRGMSAEARLVWVLELCENPARPLGAIERAEELVVALVDKWREGNGDVMASTRLAGLLETFAGRKPTDWREALAEMASAYDGKYVDEWEELVELFSLLPDQFPESRTAELAGEFESAARDELRWAEDHLTEDALDRILRLAEEFGVVLDEEDVRNAREQIEERLATEDSLDDEDRYYSRGARGASASDVSEMDAMFGRVSDSS
jgi:hypothetical protein